MQIPVIRGVIDRRILVNFRVDPATLNRILPAPFRPKVIHGVGMVGVCLIRLKAIRPRFLPSFLKDDDGGGVDRKELLKERHRGAACCPTDRCGAGVTSASNFSRAAGSTGFVK
jgi:hypothetical protein